MKIIFLKKQIFLGISLSLLIAATTISTIFIRDYVIDKKYEFEPEPYVWDFDNITLFSSQIEERSEKILYFLGHVYTISNETYYNPITNETFNHSMVTNSHMLYGMIAKETNGNTD